MPKITPSMTPEEVLALPVTFDIETAGRAWGMGRTKARDLYRKGEFPVPVKPLGSRLKVTKTDLFAALGMDEPAEDAPTTAPESTQAPGPASWLREPPEAAQPPGYIVIAVPASPATLDALLVILRGSGVRPGASHFSSRRYQE